jgi:hypothetical protein
MKQLENIKLQEITKSDDQIIDQALKTRQEIKEQKLITQAELIQKIKKW